MTYDPMESTLRILGVWLNLRLAMMRNPLRQVAGEWRRECECDDPLCGHIHRWDKPENPTLAETLDEYKRLYGGKLPPMSTDPGRVRLDRPGLHKLPSGDFIHVSHHETKWPTDDLIPVTEFGYSHSKPQRDPTKLYERDYFNFGDEIEKRWEMWNAPPKSPNYAALLKMINRYGALWQWRIDVSGSDNLQRIIALGKRYP